MLKLIGIPFDGNSTFLKGPALAPARIRQTLHNGAANYFTENMFNPIEHESFTDMGDLSISHYFDIKNKMAELLADGSKVLTLGGDHSITYPIMQAYHEAFGEFEILQIDAHPDLYDEFESSKIAHACPFARIMEEELAVKLTQVGIRTFNLHQKEQARRFGVEILEAKDFESNWQNLQFEKPLYISLDLDGLDPAYAPGVSHHEPGGLSTREVLKLIQSIKAPIIGADIVEYNPHRDHSDMTAAVAAKFVKEIAGKMISGN